MAKAKKIVVTIVDENGEKKTSTISATRGLIEYNQSYQFGDGTYKLETGKVKIKFS